MALVGLFGAFGLLVLAELAGNAATRPVTRAGFVVVLLEAGGLGPAAWLRAIATAVLSLARLVPI